MGISIGSENILANQLGKTDTDTTATKLTNKLNGMEKASDGEMLSACKDFEAYLVEQMLKSMRKTLDNEEEEQNDYLAQFGDMRYQEYAKEIAESGQLGIAQQLYEAMKRNG